MYGIPGAGKTVLAAAAIEETIQNVNPEYGIAYYYCDYTDPKTQLLPSILASLSGQLARQNEDGFELLAKVYRPNIDQPPRHSMPSVEELNRLLSTLISHFDQVAVVVDGIDECDDRSGVVMALSRLSSTQPQTRMLLSSRHDQALKQHLSNFEQLSIAAKNDDLKLYVSAEIAQRTEKGSLKIKSTALKDEILERLVNGADGM